MISVNDRDLYVLMRAKRSHGLSREMLPHQRNLVEREYSDIDPHSCFPLRVTPLQHRKWRSSWPSSQKARCMEQERSENHYAFCMQMAPQHWIEHVATPEGNLHDFAVPLLYGTTGISSEKRIEEAWY